MNDELLRIYVNDHLAAAVAGAELAGRAAGSNAGSALGDFLDTLRADVEEERAALAELLPRVGGAGNPLKQGAAWLAVQAGRLKLNGEITAYSDLSRLEELDGLLVLARARRACWSVLAEAAVADPRVAGADAAAFSARAGRHEEAIEAHRREAARRAFGLPEPAPPPAP